MNAPNVNFAKPKPIKNFAKNVKNGNESIKNNKQNPESSASQAKQSQKIEKTDKLSNLKKSSQDSKTNKKPGEDSPEIDEYLKMISRLETKVKKDEIEEEDLEKVINALEEKILTLSEQDKVKLKNVEFFKKEGIENLKNMKKTLTEMFNDELERDKLFDFLKSPEFIGILLKEDEDAVTYTRPKGIANKIKNEQKPNQNNLKSTRV